MNWKLFDLNRPYWGFGLSVVLFTAPYLLFEPSELFPVVSVVSTLQHLAFSLLLLLLIYSAVEVGRLISLQVYSGSKLLAEKTNISPYRTRMVYLILWISLLTHLYLAVVGGAAYGEGGLLDARESFGIKGIGIPLRLHLIAVPYLALRPRSRSLSAHIALLTICILIRVVLLSERMALLELSVTLWFFYYIQGVRIKAFAILKMVALVITIFYVVARIRLEFLSAAEVGLASEGVLNLTLIYYADTTNKFYLSFFNGQSTGFISMLVPIQEIFLGVVPGDSVAYSSETAGAVNFLVDALTNPGGLAQDVNDFGKYGFFVALFLKTALFSGILSLVKKSPLALACGPIIFMQVVEYPRFNYLSMTFAFILLVVALVVGLILKNGYIRQKFSHFDGQSLVH